MSAGAYHNTAPRVEDKSLISNILRTFADILFWALIALVFNILIELAGIHFHWWALPGELHSRMMIAEELAWLNSDFRHAFGNPAQQSVAASGWFHELLFVWSGIDYSQWLLAQDWATPLLTDGLLQRDLRRFGGGRESSYVWHYAAAVIKPAIILPVVIYLSSPWSIHPNAVVLPFAALFSLSVWISAATFKKYL